MKNSKFSDEKINQYGKIGLYIFLIVLTCVGAFCVIYQAYNWEIGKNDFTNWLIACGTIASALGLIWFSYLTYKNQKNNEFYNLFKVLLDEYNNLLNKILNKPDCLSELNKKIIETFEEFKGFLFVKRLNESEQKIAEIKKEIQDNLDIVRDCKKIDFNIEINGYRILEKLISILDFETNRIEEIIGYSDDLKSIKSNYNSRLKFFQNYKLEKLFNLCKKYENTNRYDNFLKDALNFIDDVNSKNNEYIDKFKRFDSCKFKDEVINIIDSNQDIKPYLIILFRLLKFIYLNKKIDIKDKKDCFGIVRGLTPPELQLLILFNSLGFREENKKPNYTDLLILSEFFEHLPITEDWLKEIYLFNSGRPEEGKFWNRCRMADEIIPHLKEYVSSGEVIDLRAFGKSIYLDQMKDRGAHPT